MSLLAATHEPPNIVVILTDDQGPWAMGCAGNSEIRTPNLDRLAANGARFTRFFCTSPVCSPARSSLLTGRIPSQHGVHDWLSGGNVRKDGDTPIQYLDGLTAYTDVLAESGYTCGLSGKWHLGDSATPQHGFTHWYAHQKGGGPYYGAPMILDRELVDEPGYVTDRITDDALSFIAKQAANESPFYLSVHYTAPHSPWIDAHPPAIVDSYDSCPFDTMPRDPEHPWANPDWVPRAGSERWRESLKGYFAAVTAMDASVGRILDALDRHDLTATTLICFLSDNGFSCGHHGIWGKGNGTFPLNMYDESVLVPAIMRFPTVIPSGTVIDAMISGYDFAPTLLAAAGLEHPDAGNLPGRSFWPLITSSHGGDAGREAIVVFDEYGPVRMIRTPTWKYIHRYPYGPHELYDLIRDPGERINRLDDPGCTEVLRELRQRLARWFQRFVDPGRDGAREPVTGSGQRDRAGAAGPGWEAFAQDQRHRREAVDRRRGSAPTG